MAKERFSGQVLHQKKLFDLRPVQNHPKRSVTVKIVMGKPRGSKNGNKRKDQRLETVMLFGLIMLESELSVHRIILANVVESRRPEAGNLTLIESKIHEMAAEIANRTFSEHADLYPLNASTFARLLDDWKQQKGL
jgi:hypothetical protein